MLLLKKYYTLKKIKLQYVYETPRILNIVDGSVKW